MTNDNEEKPNYEIVKAGEALPEFDRNDPDFEIEAEPDVLRERLKNTCAVLDKHYLLLGYDLFQVAKRKLYLDWHYESVDDYVYTELGRGPDWLKVMLSVWRKYQMELAIPQEKFAGIGFTKAKEMRTMINKENADFWLEKARTSSLKELREALRAERSKMYTEPVDANLVITPGQTLADAMLSVSDAPILTTGPNPRVVNEDDFVKKLFSLAPSQFRLLETLLLQMQAETGSDKDGHNLTMAISEFLLTRESQVGKDKEERPLLWMRAFEERFGGNLVWIKDQEQADFLRAAVESNKTIFEDGGMTSE